MTTMLAAERTGMFTRCLFCHRSFPANGQLAHMPRGRKIAFDPVQGRLWAVCEGCHRWNLAPIEERGAALYELEKITRDHARPIFQSLQLDKRQQHKNKSPDRWVTRRT